MEKYKNTEERREKLIRGIYSKASLADKLVNNATMFALQHAKKYPKSLTLAAGIGLFVATRSHCIPYSVDEIAEFVGADRRQLRRRVTKVEGVKSDMNRMKEAHLHKLLGAKDGLHPKVIEAAYQFLPSQLSANPRMAAQSALKAAKEEYDQSLMALEGFNFNLQLAQKQNLLPAKRNNMLNLPKERILSFLSYTDPESPKEKHPLLLLQLEEELLDKALNVNLYSYSWLNTIQDRSAN